MTKSVLARYLTATLGDSAMLLIILLIVLIFGGGWFGYDRYGAPGIGGVLLLVVVILLLLDLTGNLHGGFRSFCG